LIFLDANFLVYLNLSHEEVVDHYLRLLRSDTLFTDPLVLDEVIYVSKKKYGVKYCDTISFLDEIVLALYYRPAGHREGLREGEGHNDEVLAQTFRRLSRGGDAEQLSPYYPERGQGVR
jgi:PIN domain.